MLLYAVVGLLGFTVVKYSLEGDIQTSLRSIQSKDEDKDPLKRMYELVIAKETNVKWNRTMIISLTISVFLVSYFQKKIQTIDTIVIACIIFLAIDLPVRFDQAHRSRGITLEASRIYGENRLRTKESTPEENALPNSLLHMRKGPWKQE